MKVKHDQNDYFENSPFKNKKCIYNYTEDSDKNYKRSTNRCNKIFYESLKVLLILIVLIILLFGVYKIYFFFHYDKPIIKANNYNNKKVDIIGKKFYLDINKTIEAINNTIKINNTKELESNVIKESNNTILNKGKETEKKTNFISIEEKLYLKDNLSNKILHILNNTGYKNTILINI